MVSNQVKWAQQEVYKAGNELVTAKMRLEGAKYATLAEKAVKALIKLNDALVKDIRKG